MRRIPAAAFILFALTTGCTRTATTSEPSPSTLVAATSLVPPSTVATPIPAATESPASLLTATERSSTTIPLSPSEPPEHAASKFVTALIDGRAEASAIDVDLWQQTVDGGRIIQTTALHSAADRATVAVSIAFDTQPGGEEIEPIGLRVELRSLASGWTVDGIGYL